MVAINGPRSLALPRITVVLVLVAWLVLGVATMLAASDIVVHYKGDGNER